MQYSIAGALYNASDGVFEVLYGRIRGQVEAFAGAVVGGARGVWKVADRLGSAFRFLSVLSVERDAWIMKWNE